MLLTHLFFKMSLFVRSFKRFSKRSKLFSNALSFREIDCYPKYLKLKIDFSCYRQDEALSEEFCEMSRSFEVFLLSNFYAKKSCSAA